MNIELFNSDLTTLPKADFKVLIDQLEEAMHDLLKQGNMIKAMQLNKLLGDCIDIYQFRFIPLNN